LAVLTFRVASPYGVPRIALRRKALGSGGEIAWLTHSSHIFGLRTGPGIRKAGRSDGPAQ